MKKKSEKQNNIERAANAGQTHYMKGPGLRQRQPPCLALAQIDKHSDCGQHYEKDRYVRKEQR